ncbi:MAG: flagellar hook-associated protein FlgK [Lachnospiraceae bacterium]|nr:flagellar hook-associated protein FlgK [Lachnospiraceae bacterium]
MPSQFFGLNIAYSSLLASNAALNTTANNIANEETKGYSKQQVVTQASDALRVFSKYGCAGAGVDTLSIERLRNEYYDIRYWNNNANLGEYTVKDDYMKMLEDYFKDDDEVVGFNTLFGAMYDALEELSKHGGDATYKQAFLQSSTSLTDYFNSMYASLQNTQKDLNAELKVTVDQINSYASEIASLNKRINVIEQSGGNANELRDQRGYIVDKLSELVDVETEEQTVYDPNNPDRDTKMTRYLVKIAGGQSLVSGTNYNTLECVGRSNTEKRNQSDIDGIYDIKWSNGNNFDLHNASLKGTLKGIIDVRDGNNNEYFHGTITSIGLTEPDADGKRHQTATVEVTAEYLKDLNKSNLAEFGKIRLYDQEVCYDNFTFSYDAATDKYYYTFEMSDSNTALNSSKIGKEAAVGVGNRYQGIPYYMQQMSEWLREYAAAFNKIVAQEGSVDGYGDQAKNLFVANSLTGDFQYNCVGEPDKVDANGNPVSYSIKSTDNAYYRITAGSVDIDTAINRDAALLGTHTVATAGQDKYDVVEQMIDLHTNKSRMSFRGCSSEEFLQCILSDITLNTGAARTFHAKYDELGNTIDNLRLSVSGVDKDEEGVDLVKYQNAYTLASKMINCFTEIYDRLILQTGV